MKVFEVVTEHYGSGSNEVRTMVQYVTSEGDSLLSVAIYFKRHCDEYEEELKSVREALVVVQHIDLDDDS